MAVPAIVGLPWLAGIIGGVFGALVQWFAKWFSKRLAVIAAAVALVTGLTVTFFTAITALANGLSGALPDSFNGLVGLCMPSNTRECVSVIMTAHALRWAYDWNTRVIQWKLF